MKRRPVCWISHAREERSAADLSEQDDIDRLLQPIEAYPGRRFDKFESELLRANVVSREAIPATSS